MAETVITILDKIKTDLRISHTALDDDLNDQISACLSDLQVCGIQDPSESDPLIINVIKLWCRANYTDDPERAAAYQARYDAMKACLMMAEGYGHETSGTAD